MSIWSCIPTASWPRNQFHVNFFNPPLPKLQIGAREASSLQPEQIALLVDLWGDIKLYCWNLTIMTKCLCWTTLIKVSSGGFSDYSIWLQCFACFLLPNLTLEKNLSRRTPNFWMKFRGGSGMTKVNWITEFGGSIVGLGSTISDWTLVALHALTRWLRVDFPVTSHSRLLECQGTQTLGSWDLLLQQFMSYWELQRVIVQQLCMFEGKQVIINNGFQQITRLIQSNIDAERVTWDWQAVPNFFSIEMPPY